MQEKSEIFLKINKKRRHYAMTTHEKRYDKSLHQSNLLLVVVKFNEFLLCDAQEFHFPDDFG